jgi:hypothetical protein
MMKSGSLIMLALGFLTMPGTAHAANDYPTSARVDYVIGCMATNGETPIARDKCSCSIDAIADLMPYEKYVQAETILSMQQATGPNVGMFRDAPQYKAILDDLRRAQAEAEAKCF